MQFVQLGKILEFGSLAHKMSGNLGVAAPVNNFYLAAPAGRSSGRLRPREGAAGWALRQPRSRARSRWGLLWCRQPAATTAAAAPAHLPCPSHC